MIMPLHRIFGVFASLLVIISIVACKEAPRPEEGIYEVVVDEAPGIARFTAAGEGVYYPDDGTLYPEAIPVRLDEKSGELVFPDGTKKKFTFKLYQAPTYTEPSPVLLYRDSVYSVNVERDVLYGEASGFWTSYPPQGKQDFSDIYFERAAELQQKRNCPLMMDVYQPDNAGLRRRPLFVMIHGGAFYNGDKAEPEFENWCRYFASLGYVAASINYRMGYVPVSGAVTRAGYRALQDANAAVRYLVGHYRVDPELVFVAGTSAGAITALNLAFMQEETRPSSTKGGWLGKLTGLVGWNVGDEGPITAVNPEDTTYFNIRAVGNMWGAVPSLNMINKENRDVAVLSIHSEHDPIVPFGYDYPFRPLFKNLFESVSENDLYRGVLRTLRVSESLSGVVFDKMYGSKFIHQKALTTGHHSRLLRYSNYAHSLHQDDDGNILPAFYEFQYAMADFFSQEMEPTPVNPQLDPVREQWIHINPASVKHIIWKVEGGVIRETAPDGVRILFFSDAPNHSLTVSGEYQSGMTFRETLMLNP